ncbi:hypothetical protein BKA58DRAFT_448128 [Alternaria rosae]|uniref:uncharacterized protein n=1 Tax=Alternaria rosae TaxID=1187941 RepID=UPI001E8D8901|nr:uncharacterized protein BKA58DRAFT_448128 [Alternaria rosae]KAH6883365.1 hypothetical protein BKA58DRAFT_448128 [Alternaria rosae]
MPTQSIPQCSDPDMRAPTLQDYLRQNGGTQPKSALHVSPISSSDMTLQFKNVDEARACHAERSMSWHPPRKDSTIPRDDGQRKSYVRRLRTAMLGIPLTLETAKFFATRWRHSTRSNQPPYHLRDMWTVCEELVGIAERLHNNGPRTLLIYDPGALIKAAISKRMTFRKRINSMIDHLLMSKNAVDCLMRGEQRIMFVACTGRILRKRSKALHTATIQTLDEGNIAPLVPSVPAKQPRKRSADAAQLGDSIDRPTKRSRGLAALRSPELPENYFEELGREYSVGASALL